MKQFSRSVAILAALLLPSKTMALTQVESLALPPDQAVMFQQFRDICVANAGDGHASVVAAGEHGLIEAEPVLQYALTRDEPALVLYGGETVGGPFLFKLTPKADTTIECLLFSRVNDGDGNLEALAEAVGGFPGKKVSKDYGDTKEVGWGDPATSTYVGLVSGRPGPDSTLTMIVRALPR